MPDPQAHVFEGHHRLMAAQGDKRAPDKGEPGKRAPDKGEPGKRAPDIATLEKAAPGKCAPNKRAVGKIGEDAAAKHMESMGYSVLRRNYRLGRIGEVDIVAQLGSTICFVEVKSRSSDRFGAPAEAVNWEKRQTIQAIAGYYLATRRDPRAHARFDVIEVYLAYGEDGEPTVRSVNHIENAFQA